MLSRETKSVLVTLANHLLHESSHSEGWDFKDFRPSHTLPEGHTVIVSPNAPSTRRDQLTAGAHQVLKPLHVRALAGHSPSNVWYGAAQALNTHYRIVKAAPGSQIHSLPGGQFLVPHHGGEAYQIDPEKYPEGHLRPTNKSFAVSTYKGKLPDEK